MDARIIESRPGILVGVVEIPRSAYRLRIEATLQTDGKWVPAMIGMDDRTYPAPAGYLLSQDADDALDKALKEFFEIT